MTGVATEIRGPVGLITLDEPDSRNALSVTIRDGVRESLDRFVERDLRAVIITGRGPAFCAGGNLKTMPDRPTASRRFIHDIMTWFETIEQCPLPIVAAVNGPAMGGGAELLLACDMVVAAESATIGFPETKLGLMPPFAAARLPHTIPKVLAKELLLTGRVITATEARELGLVNRVVPSGDLELTALDLVTPIADRSALATQVTKELANHQYVTADQASRANVALFTNADTRRRVQAFIDRSDRTTRGDNND